MQIFKNSFESYSSQRHGELRERFATIEEDKNRIGHIKRSFQKCFEDWKRRCQKCIISDSVYFDINIEE